MTDALCETSRSLSPFLIQHALLLATTSWDLSSLGCVQERPWKARGRRSCLYPKKALKEVVMKISALWMHNMKAGN